MYASRKHLVLRYQFDTKLSEFLRRAGRSLLVFLTLVIQSLKSFETVVGNELH